MCIYQLCLDSNVYPSPRKSSQFQSLFCSMKVSNGGRAVWLLDCSKGNNRWRGSPSFDQHLHVHICGTLRYCTISISLIFIVRRANKQTRSSRNRTMRVFVCFRTNGNPARRTCCLDVEWNLVLILSCMDNERVPLLCQSISLDSDLRGFGDTSQSMQLANLFQDGISTVDGR